MGIDAMKLDCEDLLFDNVSELCSSAVRGALVAPEGRKLVVSDLSNIEGRVLAWLAGENWKTEAFRQFDYGVGADLYKLAYAKSFNKKAEDVTKDERQIGKVQELALGYQGSVGAFSSMAALYGVFLPEREVRDIVDAWRKAHKRVTKFWYALESAVKDAIREPGKRHVVRDLGITFADTWLRIKLPSGRYLCYPNAGLSEGSIVYDGVNQYTKKWEVIETYGGKLVENVVQAVARDVLASGMFKAEEAGYAVCLHVHDELITETPDDPSYNPDGLAALMSANPSWAMGLPLAAAGFETHRYKKD
jgi:DNA polymerase